MIHDLIMRLALIVVLISVLIGCRRSDAPVYALQKSVLVDSAAIATAHLEATRIGYDILRAGGNAADAAVAVQFALAVCYPLAGNIGGGGFMIHRSSDGTFSALDFRESAPAASHADMFLDSLGQAVAAWSQYGHRAVGIPGSVQGMHTIFQRYSRLKDWGRLVQPAADLARRGFRLTDRQANKLNEAMPHIRAHNTRASAFVKDGDWKKGDRLQQVDLARTLEAIRDAGPHGFYAGWVADSLVAEMKRGGGLIDHADLLAYKAKWREPMIGLYRDHTIVSMPPPSSGGIVLLQLLEMVEPHDLRAMGFHSTRAMHVMVEAERRAYADRATHLGDPDFYPVPIDELLDSAYLAQRMDDFHWQSVNPSDSVAAGIFEESEETTHFSIVDAFGNAISITTTLNTDYGSKVVVGGAGFFLNNEMDDFSAKPGVPNYYGLIGAEANKIEAGKRMLSSMTPTIVEKDGALKLVVGTPGGSTIITSVFQVIVNIIDFEMSATDAVHRPRFHHQWLPDELRIEANAHDDAVLDSLRGLGHQIVVKKPIGKVEAILITSDGRLEGVADIRADDHVMGY